MGSTLGRVTGYYEPLLKGSRVRTDRYRYPLYAPPDDLLTVDLGELFPSLKNERVRGRLDGRRVVPYWSRADIEAGKGGTSGGELVWLDDPVEAFFVQVQGSGRVQFPDGSSTRIGYADQNGLPYRSIGRVLIDSGELTLETASMQGIKAWGTRHPDQLPALLDENPSYVFFREVDGQSWHRHRWPCWRPRRAAGRGAERSPSIRGFCRSARLFFLATTEPLSNAPLRRLVLAQGHRRRNPRRAARRFLLGARATTRGESAGRMNQRGACGCCGPKARHRRSCLARQLVSCLPRQGWAERKDPSTTPAWP